MKRSPLRRKSNKVRAHTDDELKKAYMRENPYCELLPIIAPFCSRQLVSLGLPSRCLLNPRAVKSDDPHHIAYASIRKDAHFNLLGLCRPVHNLVELRCIEGFVWCMWAKKQKGELDIPALSDLMHKSVPGMMEVWMEKYTEPPFINWYRESWDMLSELFRAI